MHHLAPQRSLLRDTGAFLNITSVLNTEERLERLPELCIEVLKTRTQNWFLLPSHNFPASAKIGGDFCVQITNDKCVFMRG
jgi:hypothetical protein